MYWTFFHTRCYRPLPQGCSDLPSLKWTLFVVSGWKRMGVVPWCQLSFIESASCLLHWFAWLTMHDWWFKSMKSQVTTCFCISNLLNSYSVPTSSTMTSSIHVLRRCYSSLKFCLVTFLMQIAGFSEQVFLLKSSFEHWKCLYCPSSSWPSGLCCWIASSYRLLSGSCQIVRDAEQASLLGRLASSLICVHS